MTRVSCEKNLDKLQLKYQCDITATKPIRYTTIINKLTERYNYDLI